MPGWDCNTRAESTWYLKMVCNVARLVVCRAAAPVRAVSIGRPIDKAVITQPVRLVELR